MRSYRELWLWLGAAFLAVFAAFIAIGLAYFTKEEHFSFYTSWQTSASIAAFALAFACFFCAITGVPFPPWSKVKFPNILFEIYGASAHATTRLLPNGMRDSVTLAGYRARITNLENEQNAGLTFTLFLKLDPGPEGGVGEGIGIVPDWPLDPNLSLNMLQMPIVLAPGTSKGGDLVYDTSMVTVFAPLAQPPQIRFRIEDHISRRKKDVVMEASFGSFTRDEMVDSRGGARIVEPQKDAKPEETVNASDPSPPSPS